MTAAMTSISRSSDQQGSYGLGGRNARGYSAMSSFSSSQVGAPGALNAVAVATDTTDNVHHHNSRICWEGYCSVGIEREILRHPDTRAHLDAVSLCLRLPLILLRSIAALRQEAQLQNELKAVYGSLMSSPPQGLFHMILELRTFPRFESSNLLEQLRSLKDSTPVGERRRHEAGKTAPDGMVFVCPSSNCKKPFRKSGHAQNHVEKRHPEYLQLHPDYQPQQFIVDTGRSGSTSPVLDRQTPRLPQDKQPESRHEPRRCQASSTTTNGLGFLVLESNDCNDLLSPSSFGLSSSADTDEQPQLTRSRSNSRPSSGQPTTPQASDLAPSNRDGYHATRHFAPRLSKRGRDSYPPSDLVTTRYKNTQSQTVATPQRRHAKHLSTPNYWQV